MSDTMNIVIVEGGPKGILFYKKLMMNRIDWSTRPDGADPLDEPNQCLLVWEGEVKHRSFKYFKLKTIPSFVDAKSYLESMNAIQFWNIADKYVQ